MADIAIGAMKRHLFYLTEENVVMSLFSNRLSEDEKSRMACRLLSCPKPESFKVEKPKPPTLDESASLVSLIGDKSWTMFHVLGVSADWLKLDPSSWCEDPDFCEARDSVRTAKVVNDSCERAIKMIQDFCNTLTSDSKGVDSCREQYPDFHKKTLNKGFK